MQEKFRIFVIYRRPANFLFSFFPVEILSNAWMLLC